jgi:sialidase-1
VTVSRDDSAYELLPDVARIPSGELVCVYRESDGHRTRNFSGIAMRTSMDEGRSWSTRRSLVEARPDEEGVILEWNRPHIQRLSDGRLLALCDVYPTPPGEDSDRTNAHTVLWWSEDAGESWSEPLHTTVFGIVPDRVIELPSGAWLLATCVRMKGDSYDRHGNEVQIVHRSEDQGKTWQGPYIVGQDDRYDLSEGSILLLPDGELVCYIREDSAKGLPAFKSFSNDEGRTWDGVYATPMDGCHAPKAGLLPSGKVLVTYRYQQAGTMGEVPQPWTYSAVGRQAEQQLEPPKPSGDAVSYWARNTMAYLETVESAKARELNRQGGIILTLDHDRSPRSDGGYTGWVVLHSGKIFCVNYIVDDAPLAQIRGYWFDESDF